MRSDAVAGFLRAVTVNFMNFGGAFRIEELVSTPWASVTFRGARHRLAVAIEGVGAEQAADAFAAGLDEAEFDVPGHIVADIAVVGDERAGGCVRLTLEALTVEDD